MRRLTLALLSLFYAASALAAGMSSVEIAPISAYPYFNKVALFIQGPMSAKDLRVLRTQVIPQARELLTQGPDTPNWLRFKAPRRTRGLDLPGYWAPNDQHEPAALPVITALAKRDPDARTLPVLITNGVTLGSPRARNLGFSLDTKTKRAIEKIAAETGLKLPRRGFVALANDDPHEEHRLIDDPEIAAYVLAHEIGHALGLKHPKTQYTLMSQRKPGTKLTPLQNKRIKRWIETSSR